VGEIWTVYWLGRSSHFSVQVIWSLLQYKVECCLDTEEFHVSILLHWQRIAVLNTSSHISQYSALLTTCPWTW